MNQMNQMWSFAHCRGLRAAIAPGLEPSGAYGPEFHPGSFEFGAENRVRMQPGNRRHSHDTSRGHIALPMDVAYNPALPVSQPPVDDSIGTLRVDLAQDECPGPAGGRMR